jgi:hypothetical protein
MRNIFHDYVALDGLKNKEKKVLGSSTYHRKSKKRRGWTIIDHGQRLTSSPMETFFVVSDMAKQVARVCGIEHN